MRATRRHDACPHRALGRRPVRLAIALPCSLVLAATVLSAHAAGAIYAIPVLIDGTGTTDVTSQLQSFLNGVPDGSTIELPAGGRYRVEGTLTLQDRHDLTIEGNG